MYSESESKIQSIRMAHIKEAGWLPTVVREKSKHGISDESVLIVAACGWMDTDVSARKSTNSLTESYTAINLGTERHKE